MENSGKRRTSDGYVRDNSLFLDLYLAKFLDTSAKLFFPSR